MRLVDVLPHETAGHAQWVGWGLEKPVVSTVVTIKMDGGRAFPSIVDSLIRIFGPLLDLGLKHR